MPKLMFCPEGHPMVLHRYVYDGPGDDIIGKEYWCETCDMYYDF